jgi:hypothetical protein
LYNFSKKYGYNLLLDSEHPLFKFLENNTNFVKTNPNSETEEFLPPISYNDIYVKLENIFKSGRSFSVMTNSFYNFQGGSLENFGAISEDCSDYMRDILSPSFEVETKLDYIFNTVYKIDKNSSFKVIHLRFGDDFIHNNLFNDGLYKLYYNRINNLVNQNKNEKYVLISDSSKMANNLKTDIQELLYWDNSKIHLGDLKNIGTSNILDTVVDFFIMSKSNEIISSVSGFSCINSIIFNIKYTRLNIYIPLMYTYKTLIFSNSLI